MAELFFSPPLISNWVFCFHNQLYLLESADVFIWWLDRLQTPLQLSLYFKSTNVPFPEPLSLSLSLSSFLRPSNSASHSKRPPCKSACFKRCYILDTADWPWLIIPRNLISQVLKRTCWFLNWMYLLVVFGEDREKKNVFSHLCLAQEVWEMSFLHVFSLKWDKKDVLCVSCSMNGNVLVFIVGVSHADVPISLCTFFEKSVRFQHFNR